MFVNSLGVRVRVETPIRHQCNIFECNTLTVIMSIFFVFEKFYTTSVKRCGAICVRLFFVLIRMTTISDPIRGWMPRNKPLCHVEHLPLKTLQISRYASAQYKRNMLHCGEKMRDKRNPHETQKQQFKLFPRSSLSQHTHTHIPKQCLSRLRSVMAHRTPSERVPHTVHIHQRPESNKYAPNKMKTRYFCLVDKER